MGLVGEPKRLLVVDDDPALTRLIRDKFIDEGYDVTTFTDGPEALDYVERAGLPHLALIDLKLTTWHGFELSRKLKERGDLPIVFITGNDKTDTVVKGLTEYADDYVTKPFELAELVARVWRVLSRIASFEYAQTPVIQVDDWLSVDFGNSQLLAGGKRITLTPTEANLLHVLLRNAGRVVTSETLIARVWPTEEVYEDTLRVHMHRLRRKVEPERQSPKYIKTERGIGYRFVAEHLAVP